MQPTATPFARRGLPLNITAAFVFSLATLFGPDALYAQRADTVRTVFEAAKRGNWYLRVATDQQAIQGRVPFIHDESVTIGSERIPFRSVATIERRHPEGTGTRMGAIAGGLTFGALGWALASELCESNCVSTAFGLVASSATVGAALGGIVGRITDPGELRWERIWSAPGSVPDTIRAPSRDGKADSPYSMGAYAGAGFGVREELAGARLATLGLMLTRDYENVELVILDLNLSRFDVVAALGVLAGANWYPAGPLYLGAAGGVATATGERTGMAELHAGVTNRSRSSLRVELRTRAYRGELDTVVWYVNLGYALR